ncbi:MAG: hypothetical protein BV456_12670 [Thermoplasmata archaeon M8B2D]|nr:MAG: hypothetical protein BV456_12670 [Thermoplasmata archaeon M8B2D]
MKQQTAQIQKSVQKKIAKPVQKQVQPVQQFKPSSSGKAIIFDSGTLISFSMNGVTDLIRKLKGIFKGKFLITQDIKREVIDTPLKIKRFELEALKIKALLDEGIIEMPSSIGMNDSEISSKAQEIMNTANKMFASSNRDVHLLDVGECSCLALSKMLTEKGIQNVLAVDERTTRMLSENHEGLRNFLQKKLHTKIKINEESVKLFQGFRFLRSTELAYVAYKKGLVPLKNGNVLDALLYAMKFKGAAISGEEIQQIERLG